MADTAPISAAAAGAEMRAGAPSADLEALLPLELIRDHTKSDDDPRVSDTLLALYRRAAFDAAEKWTGQSFRRAETMTEILPPLRLNWRRPAQIVRLRRKAEDGYATLHGGGLAAPQRLFTQAGGRQLAVPFYFFPNSIMCCAPCGAGAQNPLKATYKTGYACRDGVPSGIVMGCLKYIAWQIGNPGDELVTQMDYTKGNSTGIAGTNNAVIASGAAEEWRIYQI